MHVDRLVSLLLLLQGRERLTATALARRLEVSLRTVYRDLDALARAGIPVYAQRGVGGGISLMEGWRVQLNGLTRPEVQALAALSTPQALEDLGLASPLRSGLIKLTAALPASQQTSAEQARQRLHVDSESWFGGRELVPSLPILHQATWDNRRVKLAYRDLDGARSEREVYPYGLVIKGDRWYLVAGTRKGPRTFRGSRILRATLLSGTFERPRDFDLPAFWTEWCRSFAEKRPSYPVTLRLTRRGAELLRSLRPPSEHAKLTKQRGGSRTVTLDFEREAIALAQLTALGQEAEVLEPAALRNRLRRLGRELRALYDRG